MSDSRKKLVSGMRSVAEVPMLAAKSAEFAVFAGLPFGVLLLDLFPVIGLGVGIASSLHVTANAIETLCNQSNKKDMRDFIVSSLFTLGSATMMEVAVFDKESLVEAPVLFCAALTVGALQSAFKAGATLNGIEDIKKRLADPALKAEVIADLNKKNKEELTAMILESIEMVRPVIAMITLIRTGVVGAILQKAAAKEPIPVDMQFLVVLFLMLSTPGIGLSTKNVASMLYSALGSASSWVASFFKTPDVVAKSSTDMNTGLIEQDEEKGNVLHVGSGGSLQTPPSTPTVKSGSAAGSAYSLLKDIGADPQKEKKLLKPIVPGSAPTKLGK